MNFPGKNKTRLLSISILTFFIVFFTAVVVGKKVGIVSNGGRAICTVIVQRDEIRKGLRHCYMGYYDTTRYLYDIFRNTNIEGK